MRRSRSGGMKPGKSRALQPVALPKALLPDPDSLLHHIDRAVMTTEYARASQDLTNMPPGPPIFNIHPKTSQGNSKDSSESVRKARRFLQGSLVEDFLQKVTTAHTERRTGRSRRSSKHILSAASGPELTNSEPRTSGLKYNSASGNLKILQSGALGDGDRRWVSEARNSGVESPSSPQVSHAVPVSRFSPLAQEIQPERPITPKFSFFQPARHSSKFKAFTGPSHDSGSEYDFLEGERTSSASSTATGSPVERMRSIVFTNPLDFSTLLPGKSDTDEKLDSPSEVTVKYDAVVADQAYRAGSAAMEEGDMAQAIVLLRLACKKCPRNRPSALVKIEKLITAAAQQLEMQEASRNTVDAVEYVEQEPNAAEVERHNVPMKVLAVGDMLKADEAYRAGVAALEAGEPEKALEHLEKALAACPEDRRNAATKIQTLIDQAHFELRMR